MLLQLNVMSKDKFVLFYGWMSFVSFLHDSFCFDKNSQINLILSMVLHCVILLKYMLMMKYILVFTCFENSSSVY